jgi:hypothetical protein
MRSIMRNALSRPVFHARLRIGSGERDMLKLSQVFHYAKRRKFLEVSSLYCVRNK